jgi:sortase B
MTDRENDRQPLSGQPEGLPENLEESDELLFDDQPDEDQPETDDNTGIKDFAARQLLADAMAEVNRGRTGDERLNTAPMAPSVADDDQLNTAPGMADDEQLDQLDQGSDSDDDDLAELSANEKPVPTINTLTVVSPITKGQGSDREKNKTRSPVSNKRRLDMLLYLGVAMILVAVVIAGFLVWRHVSTLSTYKGIKEAAHIDTGLIEDGDYVPSPDDLHIDWEALHKINPDIVAWLYGPGTQLRYPVVQGRDNSYYLNHTADNSVNASGAIFMDYQNSKDFSDASNYVYGHNMLGNTMFSEMTKYTNEQFLRDHPRILIITPTKTYDLTVVCAIKCSGTDPIRGIYQNNDAGFRGLLGTMGAFRVSGSQQELINVDNIYCFSTCELFDLSRRVVVIATDTHRGEEPEAQGIQAGRTQGIQADREELEAPNCPTVAGREELGRQGYLALTSGWFIPIFTIGKACGLRKETEYVR